MFLSSPSGFADDFDCNLETRVGLLTSDERTAWVSRSIVDQFPHLANAAPWERWAYAQYHAHYGFIADPAHVQRVLQESRTEFNNRFGVLCMTANPASNHIWNAYAGDFTGFCIGFQPEIFEGYANGPIHYVPELPVFRGDEDTMAYFVNLIYLKHEQYRAEAEYRISRFWPPNEPTINQRKLQATPQQVAEVIIGYKAPAEFADFVYKQLPNTLIRIANPDGTGGVILS